jgi:peptidoglycan/LPS O-acetylase OafA/YrhL
MTLTSSDGSRGEGATTATGGPTAPPIDTRVHVPVLDGLRGLAVILVLLVHFSSGGHHGLLLRVYFRITGAGWTGVDLFFVLSGFLITRILLAARESPRYFRNFYARRVLRIFPLFYGVLVFALLVAPLLTGA